MSPNIAWLVVVVLCVLVSVFAKQLCAFDAWYASILPDSLRRMYLWKYFGRQPDDPVCVGFVRVVPLAIAALISLMFWSGR